MEKHKSRQLEVLSSPFWESQEEERGEGLAPQDGVEGGTSHIHTSARLRDGIHVYHRTDRAMQDAHHPIREDNDTDDADAGQRHVRPWHSLFCLRLCLSLTFALSLHLLVYSCTMTQTSIPYQILCFLARNLYFFLSPRYLPSQLLAGPAPVALFLSTLFPSLPLPRF